MSLIAWCRGRAALLCLSAGMMLHAACPSAAEGAGKVPGKWSSRTQLVLDGQSRQLARLRLQVWDPHPDLDLEFYWEPTRGANLQPSGAVTGWGTLTWRVRGAPRYARSAVHSVYKGEMRNGRPDGVGRLKRRDGLIYEGEWAGGLFHGQGQVTWPGGDQYEGAFRQGRPHGMGRHASAAGEIYTGPFHKGRRHGRGEVIDPEGRRTVATWSHGIEGGRRAAQWKPFADARETVNLNNVSVGVMPAPEQELSYKVGRDGIVIEPPPKVLKLLAGEGVITAYEDAPLGRRAIDIKVQVANKNAQPVYVRDVYLDVAESVEDRRPLLVLGGMDVCTGLQSDARLTVRNHGWAPLEDVKVEFGFADGSRQRIGPWFEKTMGRLGSDESTFEFKDALVKMGVKADGLSEPFDCRRYPNGAVGCLAGARKTGTFGRLSKVLLGGDVGALYDFLHVPIIGKISYAWSDQAGKTHRGATQYALKMNLQRMFYGAHECGEVVPYDPEPARRPMKMRLGARNYQLSYGLNRKVRVAKRRAFAFLLAPGRTSRHRFRAVVEFSDGSRKRSPWVKLHYYRANKRAAAQ